MTIEEENDCLIITQKNKWSPMGVFIYGTIAGIFIGIANDKIEAGLAVFGIVSVFGIALTLYERLSRYQSIIIDFKAKTLKARNLFLKWNMNPFDVADFDLKYFNFSVHRSDKKMFRTYWLNYKGKQLILLLGKESMEEITEIFKKYGSEPQLKIPRIGNFVINDGGKSY